MDVPDFDAVAQGDGSATSTTLTNQTKGERLLLDRLVFLLGDLALYCSAQRLSCRLVAH